MINKKFTLLFAVSFLLSQITAFSSKAAFSESVSASGTVTQTSESPLSGLDHTNEVIIKYKNGATSGTNLQLTKVKVKNDTELQNVITKYENNPNVEIVQPNYVYKASMVNDTYRNEQWGLDVINADSAWSIGNNEGKGVKVAVLDTGIDVSHPDLAQNIIPGVNTLDGGSYDDDNGHGTFVAGEIAAVPDNGIGIAGIAGKASLMPVKVLDKDGYGTSESISKGLMWAADNGADIINMSLGGGQDDTLIHQAIDYAYNKGCVLVAAAGNDYSSEVSYPAAYDHVIAVSALNEANGLADFSNYGPRVDVAAPGVNIISTVPTHTSTLGMKNYGTMSGTSMAAPFVSGIAALIKGENPGATQDYVKEKITQNAYDLGETGKDILYGNGVVNAAKALGGQTSSLFKKLSGDGFEDNNGFNEAQTFSSTANIKGNIYPQYDIDWYKFVLPAGMDGVIDFSSPSAVTNTLYVIQDNGETSNLVYNTFTQGTNEIKPASNERTFYLAVLDAYDEESTEDYSLNLTVKKLPPTITIGGVSDKASYNYTVTPVISSSVNSYSALLNVVNFTSGTPVFAEGNYKLEVTSDNGLGDITKAVVNFTVDKTAPIISISGVSNGSSYKVPVTPQISANEDSVNALLNGAKYTIGTPITASGTYKLDVQAIDAAGNKSNTSITFTIDNQGPKLNPITTYYSWKVSTNVPIKFNSNEGGRVNVLIYDQYWRLIRNMSLMLPMNYGDNTIQWDGKDAWGKKITSGTYYARLTAYDNLGNVSNTITSTIICDSTSPYVSLYSKTPSFKLYSSVSLRVYLSEYSYVTSGIYDSRERLVKQISSGQYRNSGYNYFTWDGRNSSGGYASKGTYYFKVYVSDQAGNTSSSSMRLTVK